LNQEVSNCATQTIAELAKKKFKLLKHLDIKLEAVSVAVATEGKTLEGDCCSTKVQGCIWYDKVAK
jgi:hypothetical protein